MIPYLGAALGIGVYTGHSLYMSGSLYVLTSFIISGARACLLENLPMKVEVKSFEIFMYY